MIAPVLGNRRVVQISTAYDQGGGAYGDSTLYRPGCLITALCDDGSIWQKYPAETWQAVDAVSVEPQPDAAALQAQLDAANEGAWRYEDQLNAALKSLQEIADMHVGDQPPAMTGYSEVDWVKRHVGIMRHIASTAVKTIVADEAAKPKPVDLTAELLAALNGVLWMADEWFKYSGCDATCADEYRRDLDRADAALAKAGVQ